MQRTATILIALGAVCVAIAFQVFHTSSGERNAQRLRETVDQLRDSLGAVQKEVQTLRAQTPGLGEYMSTIQLHAAKLWFAARAGNWTLARYEHDEMDETMEAAEALHARKDSVDISAVLESVRQSQLTLLDREISARNWRGFREAYGQTLEACNGCHRPAGYPFIHIILPTREPVTNQEWRPSP